MKLLNACAYGLPGGIMGLMNTNNTTKYIIVALSLFVSATLLYGAVAYATHLWPFTVAPTAVNNTTELSKTPKMTITKPTIDTDQKVIQTATTIDTKEQGKCTLTLSNDKNSFVLTNSTEGIEGKTGCLDWNIGTGSIPAGDYDVKIDFVGKTQTSAVTSKVTVP